MSVVRSYLNQMQNEIFSEREKAIYLAAWIDTEGCIGLWIARTGLTRPSWHPQIRITNTNTEALNFLSGITGHSIKLRKGKKLAQWSPVYDLILGANKCREWLPKIMPFLVVKKHQATFVLKSLELLEANKHLIGGSAEWKQKNLPELEANRQQLKEIYTDLKQLNRRGKNISGKQIRFLPSV